MRQLLVINPNTGLVTTQRLQHWINGLVPDDTRVECITARFGAPYIACEARTCIDRRMGKPYARNATAT